MRSTTEDTFGTTLRALRVGALLSQEDLAKAAGLSNRTISQLENDHRQPSQITLQRLARALGVPVAELLDGKAS